MKVLLSDIQRFSLQDGPGIRTTVFFKGCNLRCPWCANPETVGKSINSYIENGVEKEFGFFMDLDELESEILKDEMYYKNGGGVTYSGGEALLQIEDIKPLMLSLKKRGINQCIETALSAPFDAMKTAVECVDLFIVDIKILNKTIARELLGLDIDMYFDNLKLLSEKGVSIVFRMPLAHGYTDTPDNLKLTKKLLKTYNFERMEIFNVHSLGAKKSRLLGIDRDWDKITRPCDIEGIANYLGDERVKIRSLKGDYGYNNMR